MKAISETSFWEIAGAYPELPHFQRVEALVRSISELPIDEIIAFHHYVQAHQEKARSAELFFLAATVIHNELGYYTSEHVDAVTAWLVFQGERFYTRTLRNPDSMGPVICDLTAPGDFLTICAAAYKRKTGRANFQEMVEPALQRIGTTTPALKREGFVEPEKIRLVLPGLYDKYLLLNSYRAYCLNRPPSLSRPPYNRKRRWSPDQKARVAFSLIIISACMLLLLICTPVQRHVAHNPPLIAPDNVAGIPGPFTLTGHTGTVFSVAWSPDGKTLASGSNDGTVKVWDVADKKSIETLSAETKAAWAGGIAWSPDGKTLASSADDATIELWDTGTWNSGGVLTGHTETATALSWSPDSRTLASGSWDGSVRIWDRATASSKRTLPGGSVVFGVAESPNGKWVASGSRDGMVRVWDLATGQRTTFSRNGGVVNGVSWSPDSNFVAAADEGQHVQIWNIATGDLSVLTGHTGSVRAVSWSPNGKWIASCGDDLTVRIWDPISGECLATLLVNGAIVKSLAWSPDSKELACGDMAGNIKIWPMSSVFDKLIDD